MICDSKLQVRYKETDQMGVVHHSNYYTWFEVGRTDFMKHMGLTYNDMEKMGLMLPVLETHCTYKQGAKYDNWIIIRTKISEFKGVRLTILYDVIREEDNMLLAQGSTVHAFTNSSLKPVNIKKNYPDIYDLFINCIR